MKIAVVPRFLFYSSLETNRKGPWGLGCIEIDVAIFKYRIRDEDEEDYSISKILETYNKLSKSETKLFGGWTRPSRYHGAAYLIEHRANHLHLFLAKSGSPPLDARFAK